MSDQLKGLSILMVLGVHILAVVEAQYWKAGTPFSWFLLTFDQLSRFSVPFFIFSSWYGLSLKAGTQKLSYWSFVTSRLNKLIPVYVIWCALALFLMAWVPQWEYYPQFPWWQKMLLGLVDYQLYFVPLLTMLYMIFPLFQRIPTKALLFLTPLIAVGSLWWFKWLPPHYEPVDWSGLPPDASQYLWPMSWLWYAWLGLVAARVKMPAWFYSSTVKMVLLCVTLFGLGAAVNEVAMSIANGRDVLLATMFIRWNVWVYATLALMTVLSWGKSKKTNLFLEKIGQYSLVLYLTHTFFIRWGVAVWKKTLDTQALLLTLLILCVATLVLSWWLTYSSQRRVSYT